MYLIQGNHIGVRKLSGDDISDAMMDWFQDEDLMRYYTNSKQVITKEILLDAIRKGEADKNNFTYGIFDLESHAIIGTLRLGPINIHHKTSDLVVLIGNKAFHGKGLAIEAIQLGNKIAFETHELRKLFGGMYASNKSSIKAYLRAGWIVEGIRKAQYWNNGKHEDRIEVGCFNPAIFSDDFIQSSIVLNLDEVLDKYP